MAYKKHKTSSRRGQLLDCNRQSSNLYNKNFIMRSYTVLLAVLLVSVSTDHDVHADYVVKTKEDLLKFREECVAKLDVPVELVEKYKMWEYPNDEKTRCYMKCVFEQFDFFDAKTGFDVHKIHYQLSGPNADHSDDTHAKIARCIDNNSDGENACSWAYRNAMCFIRENLHLVKQSVRSR